VSHIELLRLLDSIFYLTAVASHSHYTISTITNISEEVHCCFFKWTGDMNSSIKNQFIYMPRNDDKKYQNVVGDYTASQQGSPWLYWKRGLRPYCVGSTPHYV
jgi:hypothetical protein